MELDSESVSEILSLAAAYLLVEPLGWSRFVAMDEELCEEEEDDDEDEDEDDDGDDDEDEEEEEE